MKIEVQNKKGLTTVLSIIVDKKTIQEKLDEKSFYHIYSQFSFQLLKNMESDK